MDAEQRNLSILNNRRNKTLCVLAAMGIVVLLALLASTVYAIWLPGPGNTSVQSLNSGWSYLQDGSYQAISDLPCTLDTPQDTVILRHALTEEELHPEYVLTLRSRYASVRVWADENLIYEAAQGQEHALGSMWHFIPMSECLGAEQLTVEFRVYDTDSYTVGNILLDTPRAIRYALLAASNSAIFFCAVCLLLAAVMLVGAFILARWKSETYLPLLAFAAFILLSGLWILLDSKVTTISGGNYALSYFLSYAVFYLLTVPFLLYIRLMTKDCRRLMDLLIWITTFNAAAWMILHIAGVVQIRHTAVTVHALIILSIPVTTRALWGSVIKRKEKHLRFAFLGLLAVYACGLLSILLYHLEKLPAANSTQLYILGLSLMLLGMTIDIVVSFGQFWRQKESADRYRRLAVEDSMTEMGNRNAFQIHLSALAEAPPKQLAFVLFDIDDLKQINDTLGHHVGDQAIYTASQCIRSAFGQAGRCYRIGGDEFAVILTDRAVTKIPECLARFLQTCSVLWDAHLPSDGLSFGWSSTSFSAETPATMERITQLQEEADRSLYEQKQQRKQNKENPASLA